MIHQTIKNTMTTIIQILQESLKTISKVQSHGLEIMDIFQIVHSIQQKHISEVQ